MFRLLTALVFAVVILGGLKLYLGRLSRVAVPQIELPTMIEDRLRIDVTLTFDASPDPFALSGEQPNSIRVTCNGTPVLERHDAVPAGTPLQFDGMVPIAPGKNEFYVTAHPQENDEQERAVRIRVSRGARVLAEQTLWSDPGAPVAGPVIVSIPSEKLIPATPEATPEEPAH
jgi:hypothetical protein